MLRLKASGRAVVFSRRFSVNSVKDLFRSQIGRVPQSLTSAELAGVTKKVLFSNELFGA